MKSSRPAILRTGLRRSKVAAEQELQAEVKQTALSASMDSRRITRTEKLRPSIQHTALS